MLILRSSLPLLSTLSQWRSYRFVPLHRDVTLVAVDLWSPPSPSLTSRTCFPQPRHDAETGTSKPRLNPLFRPNRGRPRRRYFSRCLDTNLLVVRLGWNAASWRTNCLELDFAFLSLNSYPYPKPNYSIVIIVLWLYCLFVYLCIIANLNVSNINHWIGEE